MCTLWHISFNKGIDSIHPSGSRDIGFGVQGGLSVNRQPDPRRTLFYMPEGNVTATLTLASWKLICEWVRRYAVRGGA
jgi:hypothetical protein